MIVNCLNLLIIHHHRTANLGCFTTTLMKRISTTLQMLREDYGVCYRDLLRYYMKPEIPPSKLTVILSAIRRLIKRDYNTSFGWTFRILVTDCLPLCEASKTQLRDLQTLFRDTFETITTFYLAQQLARSSLNTQRLSNWQDLHSTLNVFSRPRPRGKKEKIFLRQRNLKPHAFF
jgi:hypothetical protein